MLLIVTDSAVANDELTIKDRMLHTKGTRPATWWASGPESLEQWVSDEQGYQDYYRVFVQCSPFSSITLQTTAMDWDRYENEIVCHLIKDRHIAGILTSKKD